MSIILKENETMEDVVRQLGFASEWVYEIAPIAYWYENLYENGRIKDIHFSRRMREMLGYSSIEEFPDELNTLMTFTHPDDVHIMLDDAIAAGTGKIDKYDVQYRLRKADGSYLWCNATGQQIKDHNGVIVGMYGAFIDITEEIELQKRQEADNRQEELISGFAQECEAAFIGNLTNHSFRTLEDKAGIAAGFSGIETFGDLINAYIQKYVHPFDVCRFDRELYQGSTAKKMLKVAEPYIFEYRTNSNNEYVWYRATFNRISEDEVLIGFRNCDEEVLNRIVDEKLMGEYRFVYYCFLRG